MEATFWRNLFSQSILLNNWLLLATTTGYYFYYKVLLLLQHIWLLQMFMLAGYNWLMEYDLHIQGLANESHFLAQPIQLDFTSKQLVTTFYYNWLLLLLHKYYFYYYCTIICTYRVRQMEAIFWRNQFIQSLLLNKWLLLVTAIGYFSFYTITSGTTATTLLLIFIHICHLYFCILVICI